MTGSPKCQGHPSVASEAGGEGEEQQGGVLVTGSLSWAWSVLGHRGEFPLEGAPLATPPAPGKSQALPSQWMEFPWWKGGIWMGDGAQVPQSRP